MNAILQLYSEKKDFFLELLLQHIRIAATAIVLAGMIGLLLGIFISEHRRFAAIIMGITNVIYTIPSIALLGMLIPLTGIGDTSAIAAITVYALLPMIRNTYAGITSINPDIIEAARGMGSTDLQIMLRVKLPLAVTIIIAGLRNMVVMTIALTGIASFIGAGGLGVAIFRGIQSNNQTLTYAASILIAILAFTCDWLLGSAEKHIKKKRKLPL